MEELKKIRIELTQQKRTSEQELTELNNENVIDESDLEFNTKERIYLAGEIKGINAALKLIHAALLKDI